MEFFYEGIAYNLVFYAKKACRKPSGQYRMSSFPEKAWMFLCSHVLSLLETDGKFTFDWSRFNQDAQNAWK